MVKLIECPRDGMQGIKPFIPTEKKAVYINQLLKVGFDTIDFGSFVSPKAIPQLKDTAKVLGLLDLEETNTKLLAIVANRRGAVDAIKFEQISYLGYPFSISETFQLRNTNATIAESMDRVKEIQELCTKANKTLVIYISMGFGNPYGDPWTVEVVQEWVNELRPLGISIFQLSDTIGVAQPASIRYLFKDLIPAFPEIEFGAHFHTTPQKWKEKVHAAYKNGCRRFDGVLKGYGGCPMAKDQLTGNMPMEKLISYLNDQKATIDIEEPELQKALALSGEVFRHA